MWTSQHLSLNRYQLSSPPEAARPAPPFRLCAMAAGHYFSLARIENMFYTLTGVVAGRTSPSRHVARPATHPLVSQNTAPLPSLLKRSSAVSLFSEDAIHAHLHFRQKRQPATSRPLRRGVRWMPAPAGAAISDSGRIGNQNVDSGKNGNVS